MMKNKRKNLKEKGIIGKFKVHFIDNDTEMKHVCPSNNKLS